MRLSCHMLGAVAGLTVVAAVATAAAAAEAAAADPPRPRLDLDVALDPAARRITGSARWRFVNTND
ncbi:MAG: hypothetical protein ABUS79_20005, partial [Pseudomonadota bacterium]